MVAERGTGLVGKIHAAALSLNVSAGSVTAERVPVNARLHEGMSVGVAGRPVQFGAERGQGVPAPLFVRTARPASAAESDWRMLIAIETNEFNLCC